MPVHLLTRRFTVGELCGSRTPSALESIPCPGDVLLLVEVSETSADSDREVKVPLYARAGIPEVWLVDLEGEVIEVYRQPSAEGYREARQVRRGEALSPEAFPDLTLAADEVLG